MPTVTDGAFFQLNGTTFNVVTVVGGVPTTVSIFNGQLGSTYAPTTNVGTYEIYWTNTRIWFVIGGKLLHTVSASTAIWSNTMTFHVFMDSTNSDVLGASKTLKVRTATIYRLGKVNTAPIYFHVTGNASTMILKYGPGVLHKVIYNNTSGTSLSILDNYDTDTPVIGKITTAANALGVWNYEVPFFTGLTVATVGNDLDATIVYE
jgi:hypothetical protein